MTRRRTNPASCAILAAAFLAGCQGGVGASERPTTIPSPSTAAAAPTATGISTATPIPAASPMPSRCATSLPTRLDSIEDLADRACYEDTELTIDGWLAPGPVFVDHNESQPSWTIPIAALYAATPTVGEFVFDFLMLEGAQGIDVVAKPTAGLDLSGRGRWVTLHGHFNDPEAMACTLTIPDEEPDEHAGPDCDRLFVVSALEPLDRPEAACPTESPISMSTFMAAGAFCFVGHEVKVAGWEDVGEGFGGTAPIYPIDLDPAMDLAHAQLVANRWESDGPHDPIFPWLIEGSGVRFDRTDTRVVVTGMFGHPASEGCRPAAAFPWTWSPPVAWAQERCEHLFVLTAVGLVD